MPRYRTAYPPEFRRQMVDLVRSGRTPEELSREFEPTAQSISAWVKQAERDVGKAPTDQPAPTEKSWRGFAVKTIACVRSATSWQRRQPGSRGKARRARTGLPVHERAPGHVSDSHDGPRPEGFGVRLLRLAKPAGFGAGDRRRRSDAPHPHSPCHLAWNLWRAARSRRAEGQWPLCWPEADCSADASGRDRGRQPAQKRANHDAAGDRPSSRPRSRPPQLHGRAAERVVGGRHQCAAASGVRDGGRPPAIGLQERIANRRKRRWSKARVVSVTEKAPKGVR